MDVVFSCVGVCERCCCVLTCDQFCDTWGEFIVLFRMTHLLVCFVCNVLALVRCYDTLILHFDSIHNIGLMIR